VKFKEYKSWYETVWWYILTFGANCTLENTEWKRGNWDYC
jgi:hypothetical protein